MIQLDFKKQNGLIPCIVQDVETKKVLMLAYMNEESYKKQLKQNLPLIILVQDKIYGSKEKRVVIISM